MPPKKDQFSKKDLRRTASDHGIRFKGPVPPSEWPQEHKRNFDVVRAIQFLNYEDYMENGRVGKTRRSIYQRRVRKIRKKVHILLGDDSPNEPSWRDLEIPIFERFDGPTICEKCNNEMITPDYEASCSNQENQIRLGDKRSLRVLCDCKTTRLSKPREDQDEEQDDIFCSAKEQLITHASGDDLDRYRISMKPDQVIGLRAPSYIARSETHFPVEGRESVLLPFLVIEAKREKDAPGFRAILYQTAFPVRRLLRAQADIDSRDASSEPCLVWFFAYQGEHWKLHAGTLDGDKVRIYDLWEGNVYSQDGALQLLLLVDFLWSWARDVYRPAIKELILTSRISFRVVSPVSTDRFRHSDSLCPTTSPDPTLHHSNQRLLEDDVVEVHRYSQFQRWSQKRPLDASSHESLQWSFGHKDAPDWTRFGSIRHSNIAEFEFRCYSLSNDIDNSLQNTRVADDEEMSLYTALCFHGVTITPDQLDCVASRWTSGPPPVPGFGGRRALQATFFFQTYCDTSTWQVKKVLSCFVRQEDGIYDPGHVNAQDLMAAISQILSISGRDSVWLALRTMDVVLQRTVGEQGLEWSSFTKTDLLERAFDTLKAPAIEVCLGAAVLRCISHNKGTYHIDTGTDNQYQHVPRFWERDTGTGDSMLAIRSTSWPETCPKFCLFMLPELDYTSETEFYRLLKEAIALRNYYGDLNYQLDGGDRYILRQWRKALASKEIFVA